jgi:hypothetical protein
MALRETGRDRPLVVDARGAARLLGVSHGTVINMYRSGEPTPSPSAAKKLYSSSTTKIAYRIINLGTIFLTQSGGSCKAGLAWH